MEEAGSDDRISGLPDDLLRDVLLRLHSLPAAARTSILSRRWRHVWTSFPELVIDELHVPGRRPSFFLRAVEGTLAAYSASNADVAALSIAVPDVRFCRIEARRVSSWLRVASERVAGTLSLALPRSKPITHGQEIELPPCGRATEIALSLAEPFVLRLRPAASFAALTVLTIQSAAMDGRELGAFVSSMCPRLTDLTLRVNLVPCSDVSIRSASLNGIRKLVLESYAQLKDPCPTACPCRLPEGCRADNITLDSLEEIETNTFMGADDQVEFLELLASRCSATSPINVVLNKSYLVPLPTEKVSQMIRSISRPNLTVELH